SRRRHTSFARDWSSDVCSSDLGEDPRGPGSLYKRPTQCYGCLCGADKGSGERPRDTERLERGRDNPEGGVKRLVVYPNRDIDRVKFLCLSPSGEYSRRPCGVSIGVDIHVNAFINSG